MKEYLHYNRAIFGDEERQAVGRVVAGEWLSGGKETQMFERELAEWWGRDRSIAVNSGSSANMVAMQALGLPKGSEVITPAGLAFPTTISPMVYLGLVPVFVDVDLDTWCLNLDQVEQAIGDKTRAIVFAHSLGFMPDMDRLMTIAKRYDLRVFEDCADAVGSKQNGRRAGTFGDITTTSFYPAHFITTGGEGGAILTNDNRLYREAFSIRDWGRDCLCQTGDIAPRCNARYDNPPFDHRYYYSRLGLNFKLTEMQAAFGREQLKRIDEFIRLRKRNYAVLAGRLGIPVDPELCPFAFPVLTRNKEQKMLRLEQDGIQTRTLFAGNILAHPAYKDIPHRIVGSLANSNRLLEEGFFVGVGPHLTEENMHYIADKLKEIL